MLPDRQLLLHCLHSCRLWRKGKAVTLEAAICGCVQLLKPGFTAVINNCYSLQRNLFKDVIVSYIGAVMSNRAHLNPEFWPVINLQLL